MQLKRGPEICDKVVQLRNEEGLDFWAICERLSLTEARARSIYKRFGEKTMPKAKTTFKFDAHSYAHKMLAHLMRESTSDARLRNLIKYNKNKVQFENEVLKPLISNGDIKSGPNNIFSITNTGADTYMKLQDERPLYIEGDSKIARKRVASASVNYSKYVPLELRPFDGRPGSMDFLKYPSRIGEELIYRKDMQ